jgi:hypothetical protein
VIVGSLLLILVAVALLVLGLANGSSVLLIASIAASLLAAVALVVGARQAAAIRAGAGDADEESRPRAGGEGVGEPHPRRAAAGARVGEREWRRAERVDVDPMAPGFDPRIQVTVPHQGGPYQGGPHQGRPDPMSFDDRGRRQPAEASGVRTGDPVDPGAAADDEVPGDEPAAQYVTPADAARIARMADEVLVVDGRPRYHLSGCLHLRDRESEPLPVGEAVELGFTPCGACEPDTILLDDARRG